MIIFFFSYLHQKSTKKILSKIDFMEKFPFFIIFKAETLSLITTVFITGS